MKWPAKIVLIGAGKVAHALGERLLQADQQVAAVWSRSMASAQGLAQRLGTLGTNSFASLPTDADLYLLLVPDQAIGEVAKQASKFLPQTALLAHCSGATPSGILAPHFQHYGIFYPLQSFSPGRKIDFSRVPLCLFTAQAEDYPLLESLAKKVSNQVYAVSDEQRLQLHLAAVFVNNFTNYIQHISGALMSEHELPRQMLQPLLEETIAKLQTLSPAEAQTGPALRHDSNTIQRHLKLLEPHPHWQQLYQLLSNGIQRDIAED